MLITYIFLLRVLPKTAPDRKFILCRFYFSDERKEVRSFFVKPIGNVLTQKLTCGTLQLRNEALGIILIYLSKLI